MFKKSYLTLASATLSAALLVACGSSSSSSSSVKSDNFAVVNTIDAGFSDSQLSYIDLTKQPLTAVDSGDFKGTSDYTVSGYGQYFYQIGRMGADKISKYSADEPNKVVAEFSTLDKANDPTSNPYDLVFASDSKAYLIRYGSDKLWVVNPEATKQEEFKIGEIDLSAYNTTDSKPDMAAGVIVDGKLYLAMQRLEGYDATVNASYVAVIDTDTDKEVDTREEGSTETLKGIKLKTSNPDDIIYQDGLLLVQSIGSYSGPSFGGVELINTNNYSTERLIQDDATTGLITQLAIVDSGKGYIAQYLGWGNNQLCSFNPTASDAQASIDCSLADVTGIKNTNIGNLTISPAGDLWVSIADAGNPRIDVIDTANDTVSQTIDQFSYNPEKVVFVRK